MASRIGVSRMQVWRTLLENDLYTYPDQSVQHLEPGGYAQRFDLCQWITAHFELLRVILFTDEAFLPGTVYIIHEMCIRGPMKIHMRHV